MLSAVTLAPISKVPPKPFTTRSPASVIAPFTSVVPAVTVMFPIAGPAPTVPPNVVSPLTVFTVRSSLPAVPTIAAKVTSRFPLPTSVAAASVIVSPNTTEPLVPLISFATVAIPLMSTPPPPTIRVPAAVPMVNAPPALLMSIRPVPVVTI